MPKISIIIPCHNADQYLGKCLDSVINQTEKDIEIICIDDASTDNSLQLARMYAQRDQRIKLIEYEVNQTALKARKDGAMQALGDYIMFLDADDYLETSACHDLYRTISKDKVDIVQFGTRIINEDHVAPDRLDSLTRVLAPFLGTLRGKSVFDACFLDRKYYSTLWNKIYSARLCRKAFSYLTDDRLPKAQDLYAFFLVAYFANSYKGINQKPYYNHRLGSGITGRNSVSVAQLETCCQAKWTANAISKFAESVDSASVQMAADKVRINLLADCLNAWLTLLPIHESKTGFELLLQYWGPLEIVDCLYDRFFDQKSLIAQRLSGVFPLISTAHTIRTIGIYYYRYNIGGAQRVISQLIPIFIELGYRVVLLTGEPATHADLQLPSGVDRVILPTGDHKAMHGYQPRAIALLAAIHKYDIDLLSYHAAGAQELLFDLILAKLTGVRFVVTSHEHAFQTWMRMTNQSEVAHYLFRLVDLVTVLSRVDETYYKALNIPVQFVPNPVPVQAAETDFSQIDTNLVTWIGRLRSGTKNYSAAIDMMRELVSIVPAAHLRIVGPEITPGAINQLNQMVLENGLADCVEVCGPSSSIETEYQRASVCILTSASESFPLVVVESKSHGVPLVMFELPYIETVRQSMGGVIAVQQRDTSAMAREVADILLNDDKRKMLSAAARDSLVVWESPALASVWQHVILQVESGEVDSGIPSDPTIALMVESILWHYQLGREYVTSKEAALQNRLKAQLTKKYTTSLEWRLGYAITKPVRLIKHLIMKIWHLL